jgi:hypothetical protein
MSDEDFHLEVGRLQKRQVRNTIFQCTVITVLMWCAGGLKIGVGYLAIWPPLLLLGHWLDKKKF